MKKILYATLGIAILIQLIRPDFHNSAINPAIALSADPSVMGVLKKSCYDCHSQETRYPWYSSIAPVSWIMAGHIDQGRKALDFSNWANIPPETKIERLTRAKQMINNHLMPKGQYLLVHKNAALTSQEKRILGEFFDAEIKIHK
jgi:hypothetical protein